MTIEEQFVTALEEKDEDKCFLLLKKMNFEFNKKFEEYNNRAITHLIVMYGKNELLKELLKKTNVCIDLQDNEGLTPLHMAAFYKNYDAFILLIEAGAKSEIKNNNHKKAVDLVPYEDRNKKPELETLIKAAKVIPLEEEQKIEDQKVTYSESHSNKRDLFFRKKHSISKKNTSYASQDHPSSYVEF